MRVSQVMAEILKREGVKQIFAYPLNPLIEAAAEADIRPIIVRQERTGVHMADAGSRLSSGESVGIFCMQGGPGVENSFGAVAQAFSEGVPLIAIPGGSARSQAWVKPATGAVLPGGITSGAIVIGALFVPVRPSASVTVSTTL